MKPAENDTAAQHAQNLARMLQTTNKRLAAFYMQQSRYLRDARDDCIDAFCAHCGSPDLVRQEKQCLRKGNQMKIAYAACKDCGRRRVLRRELLEKRPKQPAVSSLDATQQQLLQLLRKRGKG